MSKIRVLPPEIVSKIAAGEVIERPSSVLKELIENSVDAKASSIEISVSDAGKKEIKISDNGSGIAQDDLSSVFSRHATSKISEIDDLYSIESLGFRGEALYSIAAVADVTLESKTAGQDSGWRTHIRGGERLSRKPVTMRDGAVITVKELFFNTPARKKFLKSNSSEMRHILDAVVPYAILHPGIRIKLSHDQKTVLDLEPAGSRLLRAAVTMNVDKKDLIEGAADFPRAELKVELVLGDINIQRGRKDMQFVFVNGRPVDNKAVSFNCNEIYRSLLSPGVYPLFCVFLSLPARDLDVNVHPTKREVKIKDEKTVISALRKLAEELLMTRGKARQARNLFNATGNMPKDPGGISEAERGSGMDARYSYSAGAPSKPAREASGEQYELALAESIALYKTGLETGRRDDLKERLGTARYIGNLLSMYVLFDTGESLLIVDQHAAQERITFERLRGQIENSKIEVQNLLSPILLKLTPQELAVWDEAKGTLEKVGFATSLFDKETLAIHSHPELIAKPENSVRNLLAGEKIDRLDPERLSRMACRSSVMAGFNMNKEQALYQRDALLGAKEPFTCPHGRPTVIEVTADSLRKQFLRT